MLELLIILIIISLGVVLYGITYQILNFNEKQEAEVIIQYVEPKNCPDCNVECPKLEACEECPKCPQEECPTCPQEEQLSRAQLKQAMMSQLADELTAGIAQENPEVFKAKMEVMTLQIVALINLAQNNPETLKAQMEPMMSQLATGLTAKLAKQNPEALKAKMEEMMPLLADELIAKLAKQNPETFKAQMEFMTSQLVAQMNLAQNNPDSFKTQIESMASLIVDGPNNNTDDIIDEVNEVNEVNESFVSNEQSKEQYTSKKWCSFGEEGVQLLPTIKPFESLKD